MKKNPNRVSNKDRELSQATELAQASTSLRGEVEARILARHDDATIARDCSLVPEVVHWFEALFFNVRDRLHARDWITLRAIRLHQGASNETIWRAFAYHGGPIILEIILAVTRKRPFPAEVCATFKGDPRLAEAHLRLSAPAAIAALTIPLGNPLQSLTRILTNYLHQQRKPGETARLKLMGRCLGLVDSSSRSRRRSKQGSNKPAAVRVRPQAPASFSKILEDMQAFLRR